MSSYSPTVCDGCGSSEHVGILSAPRSMTSDNRASERPLSKIRCLNCGLVREGSVYRSEFLEEHYRKCYSLNTYAPSLEHIFVIEGIKTPRSKFVAKWIAYAIQQAQVRFPTSVFEVGAGDGLLMGRLAKIYPETSFSGCELNDRAASEARTRGLDIISGGLEQVRQRYELIYCFGVIEHVPSPTQFLLEVNKLLPMSGTLIVGQPIQDVGGYDVYFSDHLHHFHSKHLVSIAEACGYKLRTDCRSDFMPSFSVMVFEKIRDLDAVCRTNIGYVPMPALDYEIQRWTSIFCGIASLSRAEKYAVFGAGEIATLLFRYSKIQELNLQYILDDCAERYEGMRFDLPVYKLSELNDAHKAGVKSVIIALSQNYSPAVRDRLIAAGFNVIDLQMLSTAS